MYGFLSGCTGNYRGDPQFMLFILLVDYVIICLNSQLALLHARKNVALLELMMKKLSPQKMEDVAGYFRALSEPTRLLILSFLREGEHNVGQLAELCQCTSANVSRHLSVLSAHGLVARESRGVSVYYRMADESVEQLCDLVCDSIVRRLESAAERDRAFVVAVKGRSKYTG